MVDRCRDGRRRSDLPFDSVIKINARLLIQLVGSKALHVPPGGWHAHSFAEHGEAMLRALWRVSQLVQRKAAPEIARAAKHHFNRQLEAVLAIVLKGKPAKSELLQIVVDAAGQESLWAAAINKVMAEAGISITAEVLPTIQSVMGQGYSKTNLLMGLKERDVAGQIARQARGLAQKITRIDQTTRGVMERIVRDGIAEGMTVVDVARSLQDRFSQISSSRAITIARTETSNAWTQGTANSLKQADTLTHVSVIGCQAREENSPKYRDESTCNIEDVPVSQIDALMEVGWHINHTGSLVPSAFRSSDGSVNPDGPRPAILNEQSQAES